MSSSRAILRTGKGSSRSDVVVTVVSATHKGSLENLYCELWVTSEHGSRLGGSKGMLYTRKCKAKTRPTESSWEEKFTFTNAWVSGKDRLVVHLYEGELLAEFDILLQDVLDLSTEQPHSAGEPRKWSFKEERPMYEVVKTGKTAPTIKLNIVTTTRELVATSSIKKKKAATPEQTTPVQHAAQKATKHRMQKISKMLTYGDAAKKEADAAAASPAGGKRVVRAASSSSSRTAARAARVSATAAHGGGGGKQTAMWRQIVGASFFVPWLTACLLTPLLPLSKVWFLFATVGVWITMRSVAWWLCCKRTSPMWQRIAAASFFVPWLLACGVAIALPPRLAWAPFAVAAALLAVLHTLDTIIRALGC